MTTALPFDDIRNLLNSMPQADSRAVAAVKSRDAELTKPPGSLGRLEEIASWMAAWQGREVPRIERPVVAVFAGNHGVVAQGVAAYPQSVTKQMVANFQAGGAAVNQICKTFDLGLKVFELALDHPTRDITVDAALDEADCAATMAYGMEAIAGGCDLLCVGEMGIGNTTIAAAIAHGLHGGTAEEWVGPGTGVDAEGLKRKADAVRRAALLHKPAGANSPPWRAPFWAHACSACPSSSMAMWQRPPPPCCTRPIRRRSIIAWQATSRPNLPIAPFWQRWA